jgi:hypothetical protein
MTTTDKKAIYNETYTTKHMDQLREYYKQHYKQHRASIIKNSLQYYYDNKDKLNKKIICECYGTYTYKNKSCHIKSKRHQTYLSSVKNAILKQLSEQQNESDSDTESDSD